MSDDIKRSESDAAQEDEYADLIAVPWRVQFNFTGAFSKDGDDTDVAEMLEAVIADAEKRGLFFEYSFATPMEPNDVIVGSPLEEAITGKPVRHG